MKIIDKTRVCPYLMGLEPTEVTGPLAQLQAVKAEKDGTKKLLQTINHVQGENPLSEDRLNIIFNTFNCFYQSRYHLLNNFFYKNYSNVLVKKYL